MTVRSATLDDLAVLEELWRAFETEVPPPAHEEVDLATELAEIRAIVESGLGWLAGKDGAAVGMALARRRGPRVGRITDLYVRPSARRAGVAEALTRAVAARFLADGVDTVDLEVMIVRILCCRHRRSAAQHPRGAQGTRFPMIDQGRRTRTPAPGYSTTGSQRRSAPGPTRSLLPRPTRASAATSA